MRKLLILLSVLLAGVTASATDIYLRGTMNSWGASDEWKFATVDNNIYHIDNVSLTTGDSWKIASEDWETVDYGRTAAIVPGEITDMVAAGGNCNLSADYTGPVYFNLELHKVVFGPEPESWGEVTPPFGDDTDIYLRGDMVQGWEAVDEWQFSKTDDPNIVKLTGVTLSASNQWKVAHADWGLVSWGGVTDVKQGVWTQLTTPTDNNCTLAADFTGDITFNTSTGAILFGEEGEIPVTGLSGTLPVLYINIYNTDDEGNFTSLNNEVLSKDLADKDYRPGEYWLDTTPCAWAEEAGFVSIGSKDEPLPLEMKARGNYTRTGFAKKPFKLKLGKKQNLLGLTPSKSRHYAILAHADDTFGYLRNFTGFNLGNRIGLPWTPDQQPVRW